MELFAKPGAGGIIEKRECGIDYILIQDRVKENAPREAGLLEIPAGKIREFENIYDCLRREIWEETGLTVVYINGESESAIVESNGYKVLNYTPFSSSQNLQGNYPIMVQVFICRVEGKLLSSSSESKNIRWMPLYELSKLLQEDMQSFYPMHVTTLKKYIKYKNVIENIEIDSVTKETEKEARELIISGLHERFGCYDYCKNPDIDNIIGYYVDKGDTFLVGISEGNVISTGALTIEDQHTGRIVRMSVDKQYRSRGVGARMLAELEKAARDKGFNKIVLETNNDWYSASGLYKKCGYIEYDRDEESIHMAKYL